DGSALEPSTPGSQGGAGSAGPGTDGGGVVRLIVGGTLTVTAQPLTVTAQDKSRVYGAANPVLTVQYAGFVNGDMESVLTGAPEITTTAAIDSQVGAYPITVRQGTLSAGNYVLTLVNGTLTIGKAALTVIANDTTRSYGAANPTLMGTLTGVQNNDRISASYSTTATTNSPVNTYPITPSLNDPDHKLGNYEVTQTNGTFTITPVVLTITAENKSRIYGASNPALTVNIVGFVNSETETALSGTLQLSTTATANSSVGEYPITVSGYTSNNYAINYVSGTLTIGKATLTVSAENKTKTYGAANPELTATITGFANNETASVVSGAAALTTTATTSSAAGNYPITATVGSLSATNYEFTLVNGTLTVGKALLTVRAEDKVKTYGAANPELTATMTGFVNNETSSVVVGAAELTTTAMPSSAAGNYPITAALGTLMTANYDFSFVSGTLTIGKATLTVSAENKTKTYGAANPELTVTITGFANNETVSVVSGAAELTTTASTSSGVGEFPISVGRGTLTAVNYDFAFVSGKLTIGKARLSVTADNKSRSYGAANPELTATITGFVNGESIALVSGTALLTTTATQTSGAGSYPITAAVGTLTATNYEFGFVSGTLTIGKAALTVAAANKTKVFGASVPELTYEVAGFLNGDSVSVVSGAAQLTTTATATSNVGKYPITLSPGTLSAESYEFNLVNAELTISQAATTVIVVSNQPSSLFGEAVTLTANVAAVAPGAGTPTGTITFKDGAKVIGTGTLTNGQAAMTTSTLETGVHSITAEYGGSENFSGAVAPAVSQTVAKSSATVALASSFEAVRYGQPVTLNVTVTGSGETPTGNVRFLNGNTTLGTTALVNGAASLTINTLPVASHAITAAYDGDAKNDGGTSRSLILTVNKALQPLNLGSSANPVAWKQFVNLSVNVNSVGNGLAAPTGTIVFKEGATVLGTSVLSRVARASISTNALSPGAHSIIAEFSGDSNYEANTATAISQTISKGASAIRLTSSTKTTTLAHPVVFSAQIHSNAGIPTGVVELYDGTQLIGTESLNNGWVSWTISSLGDGDHSLTAVYKGDEQFAPTTSAALPHTVSTLCTWTLETSNAAFDLSGGTGFIRVDGRNDCYWQALTNDHWITILDYGPEVGSVSFSVAPLTTGTARKGIINVAGQRLTVLQAKSVVTVSGASYTRENLAPDAIASVFGEAMASATELAQSLPLPTTLGGTQVKITDSKGVEHLAQLFYVSPLQINYLIPTDVAFGPALITIQTPAGEISGGGMIEVAPVTPGLFTANSNGSGVAAADVQRVLVDNSQRYEPVYRFDPAQNKVVSAPIDFGEEGEEVYLVLFGTGLRSRLALEVVRATIDNQDIEILYAGPQGAYVGLDQINLKLPRTLAGKGEVDLKLFVEGKLANTVRINLK
ncbi:MAG: Ig-like domain repeat protein, partial [Blastocatellia bacterium]|nr:Ig-like domain repeat protein [Blastocatellia bacterium]